MDSNRPDRDAETSALIEVERSKRVVDEAVGRHRAMLKRLDGDGFNTKSLVKMVLAKRRDPALVVGDTRDNIRHGVLAGIEGMDTLATEDLTVSAKTSVEAAAFDAESRGYAAGKRGWPSEDNPYPAGTENHAIWRSHWGKGQTALGLTMPTSGEVAPAQRSAHPGIALVPPPSSAPPPRPRSKSAKPAPKAKKPAKSTKPKSAKPADAEPEPPAPVH